MDKKDRALLTKLGRIGSITLFIVGIQGLLLYIANLIFQFRDYTSTLLYVSLISVVMSFLYYYFYNNSIK